MARLARDIRGRSGTTAMSIQKTTMDETGRRRRLYGAEYVESWKDDEARESREKVLSWYDGVKRSLPWRRSRPQVTVEVLDDDEDKEDARAVVKMERAETSGRMDEGEVESAAKLWSTRAFENGGMDPNQYAYGVLVSEIMSQQTQIDRVAEYWTRWTNRWPTAEALASATIEEVNEEWAGLGYYRRAKFLLDGARYVRDELKGVYPRTVDGLLKIPGVGPYTASAVASIAFGTRAAAVDGNVYRVLTRACLIKGDPLKGEAAREIRRIADAFLDPSRPGDFNQAMMELGATVCTPANPKCESCPAQDWCAGLDKARTTNGVYKVTELPETAKKAEKRQEQRAFIVARKSVKADPDENGGEGETESMYLLSKRPEGGLLGGLWEFPNSLIAEESDDVFSKRPAGDVRRVHDALRSELGASRAVYDESVKGKSVHVFSHIRQVMHYQLINVEDDESNPIAAASLDRELKWFPAVDFEESGIFSTGVQKLYASVQKIGSRRTPKHSGAVKRAKLSDAPQSKGQTSLSAFFAPVSENRSDDRAS